MGLKPESGSEPIGILVGGSGVRRRVFAVTASLVWPLASLVNVRVLTLALGNDAGHQPLTWTVLWGVVLGGGVACALALGLTRVIMYPLDQTVSAVSQARDFEDLRRLGGLARTAGEVRPVLAAVQRVRVDQDERAAGKIAFVAALVHDLKATVSGLKLIHEQQTAPASPDAPGELGGEVDAAQRWLTRALDALRLDQVDGLLHREACNVEDVCQDVVKVLRAKHGDRVAVTIEGNAVAELDRREFARALTNLLSNAMRAARSNVSVEVFPGLIRISDDGPGLPGPFDVLVQPFRRVETAQALTTSGTGLGLFIAHRILELHGGKLVCERSDEHGVVLLAYFAV